MDIEKLLRIREAILCFFKLHDQDPTPEIYRMWLNSLDSFEQEQIRELGFENGRQLITFQSYRLEQKGFYIREFLKMQLSPGDFNYFLSISAPVSKEENLVL